jgi:hypothetical protein
MNVPLKAITITYSKTITVAPTTDMFLNSDVEPTQEAFESMMLTELFDSIFYEVGGNGSPMDNTDIQRFEDVFIDWWDWDVNDD